MTGGTHNGRADCADHEYMCAGCNTWADGNHITKAPPKTWTISPLDGAVRCPGCYATHLTVWAYRAEVRACELDRLRRFRGAPA